MGGGSIISGVRADEAQKRTVTRVKNKSEGIVFREIALCKIRWVLRRVEYEVVLGCPRLEGAECVRDRIMSVPVMQMGVIELSFRSTCIHVMVFY